MIDLINQLAKSTGRRPTVAELVALLQAQGEELAALYAAADCCRQEVFGDVVYVRGIIEFSNICRKNCNYCGIRRGNPRPHRYRMTPDEIVAAAAVVKAAGAGTVVLQSGEDLWYTTPRLVDLIRRLREELGLVVTLSIGERDYEDYAALCAAGASRFLLRFETASRELFAALHPDDDYDRRLQCLADLRRAGFQVGSGFMIGLPGATPEDLARDLLFTTELGLDMIGCGPFIANPDTPLGTAGRLADVGVYFNVMALLRLLNPRAHIPATTAFDALLPNGRDLVMQRGANIFMPNLTPARFRQDYQLYPGKPGIDEDPEASAAAVCARLQRLGRTLGTGPGHSLRTNPEPMAQAHAD